MVADDVVGQGLLAVALHALQIVEAVVALGELRALGSGNQLVETHDGFGRVNHDAFSRSSVHREALGAHGGLGCVEGLVAKLAQRAAVDGVAKRGSKLIEVEQRRAVANLLVRHKRERKARMRKRRVVLQALHQREAHRVARLVVATQKRGAVGGDEVPAHHVLKVTVGLGAHPHLTAVAAGADGELSALIALDLRMHRVTVRLPSRVDVAAEAQGRKVFTAFARRPMGGHVRVVIEANVLSAQLLEVFHDDARHVELALRGRHRVGRQGVGLRGHLAILDKAIDNVTHRYLPPVGTAHQFFSHIVSDINAAPAMPLISPLDHHDPASRFGKFWSPHCVFLASYVQVCASRI